MAFEMVEGWTGPLDFQLKADGSPANLGASPTVLLILRAHDGTQVDVTGDDLAVVDAAIGRVRYTPDSGDLVAAKGPYYARWKVTSGGQVVFFPNGEPDVWKVYRP